MGTVKEAAGGIWTRERILALAPDEASIPAAQKVLKKGGFGTVEATADGKGWWVVCQGITDVYQVSVRLEDGTPVCDCTCPSPKYPCKHALALLLYLCDRPEKRAEPEPPRYTPGDFEALLRGVFQDPDDDTPRLVFADFLEENGETERAVLVRLQCEHAREKARSPRARELERAVGPLLERVRSAAVDPLPEGVYAEFHRGFLHLETDLYAFRDVGSLPARFTALFRNGWVEAVRVLGFYNEVIGEELAALFSLAAELDFSMQPVYDDVLLALAARHDDMCSAGRLRRVKLARRDRRAFEQFLAARRGEAASAGDGGRDEDRAHHGLTPQTIELLVRSGRIRASRRLFLEGRVGDVGAELLAAANLTGLEGLYLTGFGLSAGGIAALVNSAALSGLRELGLGGSRLGPEHARAIAAGAALGGLRVLDLREADLTDECAAELARAASLSQLTALTVPDGRLTARRARDPGFDGPPRARGTRRLE